MRITVSGLPGSGTTSLSDGTLQSATSLRRSLPVVFRQLLAKEHTWIAEFGELAKKDASYDKMIFDARQKEIARERDNIIIEGRLSGWTADEAD